jgi:ssDNA-binding Zn-finger/Zn-ribbon topoisomerase 1
MLFWRGQMNEVTKLFPEYKKYGDPPPKYGTVCPLCGGELVERENRTTKQHFIGCSNYPKCKHARPLGFYDGFSRVHGEGSACEEDIIDDYSFIFDSSGALWD